MPWFKNWTIKRQTQEINGITLLDAINSLKPPNRAVDMPLRIPILTVYKIGGVGTVAVGRIACGTLKRGQHITVMPPGHPSEASSIEIFHSDRQEAIAGDLIGFKLKNVSVSDVERGMVACDSVQNPCMPVVKFVAQIIILNHPGQIRAGYTPFFFSHTSSFSAKFTKLLQKVDKRTGQVLEENPKGLKAGDSALVELEPLKPIIVEPYMQVAPLGRIIIRDMNLTVAVGVVKSTEFLSAKALPKQVKSKSKYFR